MIKLGVDDAGVGKGLKSAGRKIEEFGRETSQKVKESFKEILAPLAGIASYAGLRQLGEWGENIAKSSKELGVSAEYYQGFTRSVEDAGGAAETVTGALEKLNAKVGEARMGSKEAREAFERWGIEIDNADGTGRDLTDIQGQIADKMHDTDDASRRAAMAMDLMGKSGKELINVLSGGADALNKHIAAADKVSEADVKALETMNRNFKETEHWFTVLAAKAYGFADSFAAYWSGVAFGGQKGGADMIRDKFKEAKDKGAIPGSVGESDAQKKERARLERELEQADVERETKGQTTQEKILALKSRAKEQEKELEKMDLHSIEALQMRVDLQHTMINLQEAEKQQAKEHVEEEKKKTEEKKKQAEAADRLKHVNAEIGLTQEKMGKVGAQYSTVDDIINSRHWVGYGTSHQRIVESPYAAEAREMVGLQQEAKQARLYGNTGLAESDERRALEIRGDLKDVMGPESQLDQMNEHLEELRRQAAEEGLIVRAKGG